MKDIELSGERIRIRRAGLEEADARFRWFADPAVTEFLPLAGEQSLPMDKVIAFLEQARRDDHPNLAMRIELLSGRLIGCGGLRDIVPEQSAEISVVIGERDLWGSGYGHEAMSVLLRFGFERMNLQTIWLIARTDNARAMRLFSKLGFVVTETRAAAAIIRGVPRDKFRMELTRDDWCRTQTES